VAAVIELTVLGFSFSSLIQLLTTLYMSEISCPISGSTDVQIFLEISEIPVLCNVLYSSKKEAIETTRGNLKLGYCEKSGHIYNFAFDPERISYTLGYENSLHHSPRFQKYAEALVGRLTDTYNLRNKKVIEIGCGNGEFLHMICEAGDNTGIGFDPSYEPEHSKKEEGDRPFRVIRDLYSEEYAHYEADFVCCRHVLEHIEDPLAFMQTVHEAVRDDTIVFFEVPNVLYTLEEEAIWDLIYEHCSYFSSRSLVDLFQRTGFEVLRIDDAFNGQYLHIEATPRMSTEAHRGRELELTREQLTADVKQFSRRFNDKVDRWKRVVDEIQARDQRAVVWGAGSKGVTILNILQVQDAIEYVVDINPTKQGKHVAGTGQRIVPPSFLQDYEPNVVIIMNSIYEEEIRSTVRELGLEPRFFNA